MLEEASGRLLEAIQGTLELQYVRPVGGSRRPETTGLIDVDFILLVEMGMYKGSSNVGLSRFQIENAGKNHHYPNCCPLYHR